MSQDDVWDDPFGDIPVSSVSSPEEFFVEDEPVGKIMEAFESGVKGVTARPETPVGEVPSVVSSAGEPAVEDGAVRSATTAAGGRKVVIPAPHPLPEWADSSPQDTGDIASDHVDYHDLNDVNRDLTRLRIRMHRVRREMRRAAREAVEAKLLYQRQLRRALVQQSGGSAEMRKASAELLCEDLEADMVMKAQVVDEYTSLFRSIRDDIENVKTISYNVRALMSIV